MTPRFRIKCDLCDLEVEVDGPSVVYAIQDARELGHDHSEMFVEYATRGGWARVGGPRAAPAISGGRGPRDELSEALLALDDDPPIEITE